MSEPDARPDAVFSPSQLNTLARDLLEDTFPAIWVEAELGTVSRPASGHLYLTLKDERAQVRAAMFKPKSTWLRFVPREGLRVLARGRVTLYEARGEYQLVLDHMEEAGEGALRRAFEALKSRLQAEGLFDAARKRALPALPRRIGVITSATGAAVRDVLSVLARRFPLVDVEVLPVPVQGEGAAAQLRAMLEAADRSGRYDVLVLARGGGALEDLWAFNDEALTRAIAAARTPVVSAIGHETDVSLSDFAADVRAPTPSVAAELLVPDARDLAVRLQALQRRLQALLLQRMEAAQQRGDRALLRLQAQAPLARLQRLRDRHRHAGQRLQTAWARRLGDRLARLRHVAAVLQAMPPERRLQRLRERLEAVAARPRALIGWRLQREALRLRALARSLETVSPLATVARGYSLLQTPQGTVVRSVRQTQVGDVVRARLADGELTVRITDRHEAGS